MKIEVEAKVYPSEDPEKVKESIKNIFPMVELEKFDDLIKGGSSDLETLENLKNKLGLQAIRDTARRKLKAGKENGKILFSLNKQAATVDKVNFSEGETPLGPIKIKIESEKSDELIDYLAPRKKDRKS